MLHTATVESDTLALLKELMAVPELQDFYLVGGTALALQIGHRWSVDLDLFCDSTWDPDKIMACMPEPSERTSASAVFQGYYVREVKCDFVRYRFPRLLALIEEDGIRMAAPLEIAAMKFMAITNRGKKKDFVDIYHLLNQFSIAEIFELFDLKYPGTHHFLVLRSLCYFGDAEDDPDPKMLSSIDWETMKRAIQDKVDAFVG